MIPCGKRTDFGYDKDFDKKYTIGKLLGHGQFGYTYVATDKSNGDRVAVKRIEKNKVRRVDISSCEEEIIMGFLDFLLPILNLFYFLLVFEWYDFRLHFLH